MLFLVNSPLLEWALMSYYDLQGCGLSQAGTGSATEAPGSSSLAQGSDEPGDLAQVMAVASHSS